MIPLALYIHVPWCIRKCPYCDFNSHHAPDSIPEAAYIEALLNDLLSELPFVWGRKLDSIFIGGGTPSLFSAEGLDKLLSGIRMLMPFRPNLEVTLEANPSTFEQEKFQAYRDIGINRLSIGIQSFNARHLSALGRVHDRNEALAAAQLARAVGFDNFNLDLMFGLPAQSKAEALADLAQAVALNPTHLSWYQLTLEPNTLFYKHPPVLPDEDVLTDIFEAGQQYLQQTDYLQYEVSAYAQAGKMCRHNRNYWEFADYIGIGAGAHGKFTNPADQAITRYQKFRQPMEYMHQVKIGSARSQAYTLDSDDIVFEFMLNALRLKEGFPLALFPERTGLPINALQAGLQQATDLKLLTVENDYVHPTELGWRFVNRTIQLFLADK